MSLDEIEAGELLRQLELGQEARARADRASQAATSDATRAQGVLDALHDGARLLANRSRELRGSANALRDALERARLSALNAGLEGARLGEPVGKAMLTMADDVRTLLARALAAFEEHVSLSAELERERERWVDELAQTRELCASAVQRLRELGGLEAASAQVMGRLQASLTRALGEDARRAELLAEAAERARALSDTLGRLRELGADDAATVGTLLAPLTPLLVPSDEP